MSRPLLIEIDTATESIYANEELGPVAVARCIDLLRRILSFCQEPKVGVLTLLVLLRNMPTQSSHGKFIRIGEVNSTSALEEKSCWDFRENVAQRAKTCRPRNQN